MKQIRIKSLPFCSTLIKTKSFQIERNFFKVQEKFASIADFAHLFILWEMEGVHELCCGKERCVLLLDEMMGFGKREKGSELKMNLGMIKAQRILSRPFYNSM